MIYNAARNTAQCQPTFRYVGIILNFIINLSDLLKKCKGTWRVPTYIAVISQKSCNTRIVTISTSWIASNVIFAIPTTQTSAIFTKRSTCTIWEPKMKIKEIIIIKNHQDTKANIQQGKSFYVLNRFRENSVQDFF